MAIRVLVVDDSAFMRTIITKILVTDTNIEVVGIARNGRDALDRIQRLQPDIVTLDVEMPELDGIGALKRIMEECPRPVIMLSSQTSKGADATIEALRLGAFDFIEKPGTSGQDLESVAESLLLKVREAAQTSPANAVSRSPQPSVSTPVSPSLRAPSHTSDRVTQILAFATSTGGPQALHVVLPALPSWLPCPIVIVQHMPPTFTRSLANRLDKECAIRVVEAEDDQVLENGTAYIAPGDYHLEVVEKHGHFRVRLNQEEKCNMHRPSADVLFRSLAKLTQIPRHLVIMTGMGNDGAKGMLEAKGTGAVTVAEAESTCVVYGMPKSAVKLGAVDYVLPLNQISYEVLQLVVRR